MLDEALTADFHLSELIRSETAVRKGIDNTPTETTLTVIRTLLAPGLQRIRDFLAVPMSINSGFRCLQLNSAIGSGPTSQHVLGQAADFIAPRAGTPLEICQRLQDHLVDLKIDQLIMEGDWVHVSFSTTPRHKILTAHFGAGATTYTEGLA